MCCFQHCVLQQKCEIRAFKVPLYCFKASCFCQDYDKTTTFKFTLKSWPLIFCFLIIGGLEKLVQSGNPNYRLLTSLSPSISRRSSNMVLKCSSQTTCTSSRATLSNSSRVARRSSAGRSSVPRSPAGPWDNPFSSSPTRCSVTPTRNDAIQPDSVCDQAMRLRFAFTWDISGLLDLVFHTFVLASCRWHHKMNQSSSNFQPLNDTDYQVLQKWFLYYK